MNKEWSRQTILEDSVKEMYGFNKKEVAIGKPLLGKLPQEEVAEEVPQVWYKRIDKDSYKIKLVHKGKEAVITEVMDRGMPKYVTLEANGEIKSFPFPYLAEKEAIKILKGEQ